MGLTIHYTLEHLHRFSKTQFASVHGWDHFRRCPVALIDLLLIWQELGVGVEISDEGEPGIPMRQWA